jgi:hypothetical protein
MKKITAFFLLLSATCLQARSQSTLTSISYNKTIQPALMLELPYNEDVSQDFIVASLKKTGYNPETKGKLFWKQNKLDGFYIFKGVRLQGASREVDLYFKVEQKGKRSKDESIIYLMASKEEGTFISSATDQATYDAASKFLNGFIEQAAAYKLELQIQDQEDVVKTAEKKMGKLQDNQKDLEKKIADLEKDLKENKEDQKDQDKVVEKEKKKLDELKDEAKKY